MKIKRLQTRKMAPRTWRAEDQPVGRPRDAKHLPGLPPEEGPWPVPQGRGAEMLSEGTGTYAPVFDAGSMLWLWELAESKALDQYQRYGDIETLRAGPDAGIRAVRALRKAAKEGG